MPGGSDYQGPAEALEMYTAAVAQAASGLRVKGAKNPYTSRRGHMFSFLGPGGTAAMRLPEQLGEAFTAAHGDTGPAVQYGSVMRGYVSIPAELLADADGMARWLDKACDWIETLPSKATPKSK
jgi:hypothetical protein